MKKIIAAIITVALVIGLSACAKNAEETQTTAQTTELSSQTTIVSETSQTTAKATETSTTATKKTTKKETTTKGTTKKETTTKKKITTTKKKSSNNPVSLYYKGYAVKPNDDMKKVLKKIGQPKSSPVKSASCLDAGYDMIYTYSGFEIETFVDEDENETIVSIDITGKDIEVGKGLKVGAKTEKSIKNTGLNFKDEDGVFTYTEKSVTLTVFDDDGKIDEIYLESTEF